MNKGKQTMHEKQYRGVLVLIIHGESTKDVINKGMKIYRCKANELKIHTIKKKTKTRVVWPC